MMLDEATAERVVLNALDFQPDDVPCEGERHPTGTLGHEPGKPAAYYVICLLCGNSTAQCAGRAVRISEAGIMTCNSDTGCGKRHPVRPECFIPIGSRTS